MGSFYFYANELDFKALSEYLQSKGIAFFDAKGKKIAKIKVIGNTPDLYKLGKSFLESVNFIPCWGAEQFLQPARIFTDKNTIYQAINYYRIVKKYINESFNKSEWIYYGSGIYNDWLQYKYRMLWLGKKSFSIERSQVKEFVSNVLKVGLQVNFEGIINQKRSLQDSFIIYEKDAKIIEEITDVGYCIDNSDLTLKEKVRMEKVGFSEESDCVRAIANKGKYIICLDERMIRKNASCIRVYDKLLEMTEILF